MSKTNKIMSTLTLSFITFLQYGVQPHTKRVANPILDEIRYEYDSQCFSSNKQMNEFYSCADMKKYIDKLEAQDVLHK